VSIASAKCRLLAQRCHRTATPVPLHVFTVAPLGRTSRAEPLSQIFTFLYSLKLMRHIDHPRKRTFGDAVRMIALGQQQSFPGVALFGSRVVFCGRLGIRYNAGQMVRDLQAHISCQSEGALAGERDWALVSPFRYLHPHFILQERAAMFIFIL
jgi:hypothetical protein